MSLLSFLGLAKPAEQPKEPEIGTEISVYRSPYYAPSQYNQYNPDLLVQKKGDLEVYRNMLIDDQVKAVCILKKQVIIGSGYTIECANEEYKKFIEYVFNDDVDGNFVKILKGILTGLHYGFSISEKVYRLIEQGEYAGKIGLRTIKTRPPHTFELIMDDYGNLTQIVQNTNKGRLYLGGADLKKFMIFSYDSDSSSFGNTFGTSDLRAAYRSWFSRDIITKFLNIYLERFGMGIIVAKYPRGLSPDEQNDLYNMVKNIQSKTSFKLPQDVEVSLLESSKQGQAGFIEALDYHSKCIARSVLFPDLMGFSDNKTGSYNLGEHQFEMFYNYINSIRSEVQELLNEHLICDLIDKNFANVQEYPKFKFNPFTQKDKTKMAELFINAVEKGVIQETEEDEGYFREILDFPKRDEESVLIPPKPKPAMPFGFKTFRQANKYEQNINFKKIDKETTELEMDTALELSKIVSRMKDSLIMDIIGDKIVETKDYKAVNNLNLKYVRELRILFKDMLRKTYQAGRRTAKEEVKKFADKSVALLKLPPKEALKYFESKAFEMTDIEKNKILKDTKQMILDGMKTGATNDDIIYNLETYFEDYDAGAWQRTAGGELERVEDIGGRVQTIVRTNIMDAYNQGRMNEFNNEYLKDFIIGYEYSAILDDRTTELCEFLDGKKYRADNPIISVINPPNHFNSLVAGTKIKTYRGEIAIEDVKTGDFVLTHKGHWRKVYDTMTEARNEEIYEIELENGTKIEITGDHPVYQYRNKWVDAKDLKEGMTLYIPKVRGNTRKCKYCGKIIMQRNKKKNKNYCSQECMSKGMVKYEPLHCLKCGKEMRNSWKEKKGYARNRKFCSFRCYFSYKGRTSIEKEMARVLTKLGIEFKEQEKIGKYFVDFLLEKEKIIIEADGNYWHDKKERWLKREKRDRFMTDLGYKVVRIGQDKILSYKIENELKGMIYGNC